MNNASLKQAYEKVAHSFDARKEHFKKVIEKMQLRGSQEQYLKLDQAMKEFAGLREQMQAFFAQSTEISENAFGSAKLKLKQMKRLLKMISQEVKPMWQQWIEAVVIALGMALILRNFVFSLYHVPTGSAEHSILVGDRLWGNKMAYFFGDVKRGDFVIFDDPREGYDESSYIQYLWQRYVGVAVPLLGMKSGPINVVKRVIAVPGDVIQGKIEDGKTVVYLNGQKLDEPYVNKYPLIMVWRDAGLLDFESVLGLLRIPDFLRKQHKLVRYTYDPSKPLADQPFYYMDDANIYKNPQTGQPVLFEAFSPCYISKDGPSVDEFGPRTVPEGQYWVMGDSRKNSEDSRFWGFLDKKYVHGRASFVIWSLDSEEAFWLFDLIKHPINFWTKNVRWNRTFKNLN